MSTSLLGWEHKYLDAAEEERWMLVAKLLHRFPAVVNAQPLGHDGVRRWSALHQAVYAANSDAIEFLLEFGADPSHQNRDGDTPLQLAQKARTAVRAPRPGAFEDPASDSDLEEEFPGDEEGYENVIKLLSQGPTNVNRIVALAHTYIVCMSSGVLTPEAIDELRNQWRLLDPSYSLREDVTKQINKRYEDMRKDFLLQCAWSSALCSILFKVTGLNHMFGWHSLGELLCWNFNIDTKDTMHALDGLDLSKTVGACEVSQAEGDYEKFNGCYVCTRTRCHIHHDRSYVHANGAIIRWSSGAWGIYNSAQDDARIFAPGQQTGTELPSGEWRADAEGRISSCTVASTTQDRPAEDRPWNIFGVHLSDILAPMLDLWDGGETRAAFQLMALRRWWRKARETYAERPSPGRKRLLSVNTAAFEELSEHRGEMLTPYLTMMSCKLASFVNVCKVLCSVHFLMILIGFREAEWELPYLNRTKLEYIPNLEYIPSEWLNERPIRTCFCWLIFIVWLTYVMEAFKKAMMPRIPMLTVRMHRRLLDKGYLHECDYEKWDWIPNSD